MRLLPDYFDHLSAARIGGVCHGNVAVCVSHKGRHAKIFGWAKLAAHNRRSTSDLWPTSHNIGIGDKRKSLCDVRKIQ